MPSDDLKEFMDEYDKKQEEGTFTSNLREIAMDLTRASGEVRSKYKTEPIIMMLASIEALKASVIILDNTHNTHNMHEVNKSQLAGFKHSVVELLALVDSLT